MVLMELYDLLTVVFKLQLELEEQHYLEDLQYIIILILEIISGRKKVLIEEVRILQVVNQ